MPHGICLCHVGGRVLAGLPVGLVLREHAHLQREDRYLRCAFGDTRPHRRTVHMERGMRLRLVHARAGNLGTHLLDWGLLHPRLHQRLLSKRIDVRDLRVRSGSLQRQLHDLEHLPEQLRLCHVSGRVLAGLPVGLVLREYAQLQREDGHLRCAFGDTGPRRRAVRLEPGMHLRPMHARARDFGAHPLDRGILHPRLHQRLLSKRIDVRDLRVRSGFLQRQLHDLEHLPEQLRLCHVGGRVLAGLPVGLVLREHAHLQHEDGYLRCAFGHTRPHRRAVRLERGMRLRPLHPRAGNLGPHLLDWGIVHARLRHAGLSIGGDLHASRIRGSLLHYLLCNVGRLPSWLRLRYRSPRLPARLPSRVVVWHVLRLRWTDRNVRGPIYRLSGCWCRHPIVSRRSPR
jgi:hypothetical protein